MAHHLDMELLLLSVIPGKVAAETNYPKPLFHLICVLVRHEIREVDVHCKAQFSLHNALYIKRVALNILLCKQAICFSCRSLLII